MTLAGRVQQVRKLAGALRSPARRRALRHGVFADPVHLRLIRRLDPSFVIDVGANNGQFALAALTARPAVQVLSFEPLRSACDRYRRALPSGQASVQPVALGAVAGTGRLHVSRHSDSSSLLEITDVQTSTFPGTARKEDVTVDISTLDEQIDEVPDRTLLKIDVQGSELDVLSGAARTLRKTRWVLCEVSFREFYAGQATATEIVGFLAQHGFELAGVEHVTHVAGASVQADLLFERVAATRSRAP